MSTPLKQHKEAEGKLHEQLFNNIFLLTQVYPTTKDFDAVFKKDMFYKNNKAAFHQVVYYLLNILNPELIKEKITIWPFYEVKYENKFRSEVLSYINELNTIYEDADIPNIMTSHLISPGGFKFVKFMWKLSQLVLINHLKKNKTVQGELLSPMKPHSNATITNIQMKHLKQKTTIIETETRQEYEKFIGRFENASQEASSIVFEQSEINGELGELVKTHESKKNVFQNKEKDVQGSLRNIFEEIQEKSKPIEQVKELCQKCDELLKYLSSNDNVLEFDNSETVLTNSGLYLNNNEDGKMDLLHLLSDFIAVVEKENMEMPFFNINEINHTSRLVEELIEKFSRLDDKLSLNRNKFLEVLDIFHQVAESAVEVEKKRSPFDKSSLGAENEDKFRTRQAEDLGN